MNSFSFFSPCFRNGWLDPCQLWVVVTQAESFVVLVGSYLHANVLKHLKHYWDIISETYVHIPQNQGKQATWWRRSLPIKILDQNYHYLMMKSLKTTFNRKMLCIFCTLAMICRRPLYEILNSNKISGIFVSTHFRSNICQASSQLTHQIQELEKRDQR